MITALPEAAPTRERILDAAIDLFGRQGYYGTSVGEIEQAAGLVPRSGGLYKHFRSKEALLRETIQQRTVAVEQVEEMARAAMTGDPRVELPLLGRLALQGIGEDQRVLRIVMRESENFPELREQFRERVVHRGHATARLWLDLVIGRAGKDPTEIDTDAIAAVMLGSVINFRVFETLFGETPGQVGEERFLEAWTRAGLMLLEAYGLMTPQEATP